MNQTEAVQLVAYLNRAGLLQAMEGQAAVWADLLEDVNIEDAKVAAKGLAKTRLGAQRWVTPGDIIEAVTRLRTDRVLVARSRQPDPPAELDDRPRDYVAWQQVYTRAIADGRTVEEAEDHASAQFGITRSPAIERARPVDQIVEQTARAMPRIPRRGEGAA